MLHPSSSRSGPSDAPYFWLLERGRKHDMDNLGPIIVALLGGGLITGIVGLVGHFVTLWDARREQRGQRETEEHRAQQDALQKYLDEMGELVDKLSSSEPKKFKQAQRVAQAWTMAILTGTGPSF